MGLEKNRDAGIYCRLSVDDERTGESVSIENQKILLRKYVKEQGWNEVETYCEMKTTRLIQFNYSSLDSILGCISWVHGFCHREKNAPKRTQMPPIKRVIVSISTWLGTKGQRY